MIDPNDFAPILRMGITIDEEIFIAKKIANLLKGERGKILDYACGNCLIPIFLSLSLNNEIYATDDWKQFDKKKAEELISKYRSNVRLFYGLEKTPFPDSYFDLIYSVLYFYNLKRDRVKNHVQEINRILKSKGKFLVVDIISVRGKVKKELEEIQYSLSNYEEANGLFFSLWQKS
ncbi:methyltransferase domain-containing protein [Sulfurisphaera javensis]|uniref:Methyltransferase domain-containing protein n=1 Tax=Sulfurisphaera javensis TaxID=2049879 RepID=A0AAT9GNI7_9CREN